MLGPYYYIRGKSVHSVMSRFSNQVEMSLAITRQQDESAVGGLKHAATIRAPACGQLGIAIWAEVPEIPGTVVEFIAVAVVQDNWEPHSAPQ